MMPPKFPTPIGVFRAIDRPTYESILGDQIRSAQNRQGQGNLSQLLNRGDTWTVN
jgi:2-oxoglutarate ferredoxin oxidoreductase subunit beta